MPGVIIAAPASGSGKTTITLGLLRALHRRGVAVRGAKSGPDYIDPRFHQAACNAPCFNLDAWAMHPDRIQHLAQSEDLLIVEGAMGLFDGAPPDGKGSCADLARILNLPVILVVDASRTAQSIAPLVAGFMYHDPSVKIAGVILNQVGSDRHERILRNALKHVAVPLIGCLHRTKTLSHPSRHLGLVQAQERPDLDRFMDLAADSVASSVDLDYLVSIAAPLPDAQPSHQLAPPAQRIAIAEDRAFAFAYPHVLKDWRAAGAEITTFSPLNDDPVPPCDFLFLAGGYPELYAGQIANNHTFMQSIKNASENADIYGECGGYMLLGDWLIDADGTRHKMAGLLRLETSFATRKLHLGYRHLTCTQGALKGEWMAHEFHYASTIKAQGPPLFQAQDAEGARLHDMGLVHNRVSGSFAHLIDRATVSPD